jgi:hypothetical protein
LIKKTNIFYYILTPTADIAQGVFYYELQRTITTSNGSYSKANGIVQRHLRPRAAANAHVREF